MYGYCFYELSHISLVTYPGERCFVLARKYFRPSEGMVVKAKMTFALWTNFA